MPFFSSLSRRKSLNMNTTYAVIWHLILCAGSMSQAYDFRLGAPDTFSGSNSNFDSAPSKSGAGAFGGSRSLQAPSSYPSSTSAAPLDGWSSMSLAMLPGLSSLAGPDATVADVDSDVLDSSSSSGEGSDGESSQGGNDEHDEEVYMEFIRSVFAADNDFESRSLCSAGTDEDDEEYRPEPSGRTRPGGSDPDGASQRVADGEEGMSSDEEELDEGQFAQISKHELQELVGNSWRAVTCPSSPQPPAPLAASSGYHTSSIGSYNSIDLVMGGPAHAHDELGREKNSMTSVLDKLFAGCKVSDICVDGIQVDSLRRLVARQLSMSLQLLVQMLMLCDERSRCENECFKHIMEISNCRSASLRKSALMRQQLKVVHQFQKGLSHNSSSAPHNHHAATISRSLPSGQAERDINSDLSDSAISDTDSNSSDSDYDGGYHHLTRSKALRMGQQAGTAHGGKVTPNSKSSDKDKLKSSSAFDIPMLGDVNALLMAIDSARKLKRTIPRLGLPPAEEYNSSDMPPPVTKSSQLQHQQLLGVLEQQVKEVMGKFDSRIWQCLIPRSNYPLRPDFVAGRISDTSSLFNRALFTPAEDDLLLRGLIMWSQSPSASSSSNDVMWDTIQEKLLPSKERQLLEFRYSQLIHSDEAEGDRFRKYLKLLKDRKRNIRNWTLEEDIDLLKGFQVFGSDKWHMINLYFLPHRPRRELKNRWAYLVKEWTKKLSTQKKRSRQDGAVSIGVVSFLHSLRTRGAQADSPNDSEMLGSHPHISTIGMMSTSQSEVHKSSDLPGSGMGRVPGHASSGSSPWVNSYGHIYTDAYEFGAPRGALTPGMAMGAEVDEDELPDSDEEEDSDDDDRNRFHLKGEMPQDRVANPKVPLMISQEQQLQTESRPPLYAVGRAVGNKSSWIHTSASKKSSPSGQRGAAAALSNRRAGAIPGFQSIENAPMKSLVAAGTSSSAESSGRRPTTSITSLLWDGSSMFPGGAPELSRLDAAVPVSAEDNSYIDPNFTISEFLNFGQHHSQQSVDGNGPMQHDQGSFLLQSSLVGALNGRGDNAAAPTSPLRHLQGYMSTASNAADISSPLRRSPRKHSIPLSPSSPASKKKRPLSSTTIDGPPLLSSPHRSTKILRAESSREPTTPLRSGVPSAPLAGLTSPGGPDGRTTFFAKVLSLAKQKV